MTLFEQLKADQLAAMRNRDQSLVTVLRMLLSELSYKVIDAKSEMTDEVVVDVLRKELKKRNESIAIYEKANDAERSAQEKYEVGIISKYVPADMDEDLVRQVVEEMASSGKRGGQLVGLVMGKLKGKVEGNVVSKLVMEKYGS